MKLSVIGLGLIGGSLALDLRERGFATEVTGVDANASHCAQARKLGLVDHIAPLEEAVPLSDFVILAIPVGAIQKLLPLVLTLAGPSTTVTDMGSTKAGICQAVASHPKRLQYVASHPMAGTENSGPQAALHKLFDGKTAVICDAAASGKFHLERVQKMYQVLGMRQTALSPAEHDLHAAYVSHLSHISSFVLANTVLAEEKNANTIFDLAGGGFESTVRLAKSSPEMWGPIFEENHSNVCAALESYISHLQGFHGALKSKNFSETRHLMEKANSIRRVLADIRSRSEGDRK
jgi:prephenate dehydrogenase